MPKELEKRLMQQAKKQGLRPGSDRFNAYVYGTLARLGVNAKSSGKTKARGR